MAKLTVYFLVLCGLGQAQFTDQQMTRGLPNGRLWNEVFSLSDGFGQLAYISGYRDAIDAVNREPGAAALHLASGTGFSNGEIKKTMDIFYADPANLLIPIESAIQVCLRRLSGYDAKAVADAIDSLRQWSLGKQSIEKPVQKTPAATK